VIATCFAILFQHMAQSTEENSGNLQNG